MDLILHIGMPKSGSTALQMHLAANRKDLAKKGILYPRLSSMKHAHHLLMPLLTDNVWGSHRTAFGADPRGGAMAEWESIVEQVRARSPETLILSTESFFEPFEPERVEAFAKLVKEIASRVTLVAYVREPAKFYASWLMERAKKSVLIPQPRPVPYRRSINQFLRALDAKPVIRAFDRAELRGSDITTDFFFHALGREHDTSLSAGDYNVSLSPESADLVQQSMRAGAKDGNWSEKIEHNMAVKLLIDIEKTVGRNPATLRPELADFATYSSKDLLWLRERFGIAYKGVDYDRLAQGERPPAPSLKSLRDAFRIDEALQQRIAEAAQAQGLMLGRPLAAQG